VCADPSWDSFSKDISNKPILTINFLDIALKKIGLEKELVNTQNWKQSLDYLKDKKCDIIALIQDTAQRKQYINFTSPYVYYPMMIVTHKDTPYIYNQNSLNNKKIGIISNHAGKKTLQETYPNVIIEDIDDGLEALMKVESGEYYGFVGLLSGLSTIFPKVEDIKINRELTFGLYLSMGIRNDDPILYNLMERSVSSISESQKNEIFNKLIESAYQKKINYSLIIKIIILVGLIIAGVVYWNLRLKKGIKDALLKNKEQESLIHYYSKQDAMKDLVGNISHQWRQPIDALSSTLMYIETKLLLKKEVTLDDTKCFKKE
jgi:hypothetical protein